MAAWRCAVDMRTLGSDSCLRAMTVRSPSRWDGGTWWISKARSRRELRPRFASSLMRRWSLSASRPAGTVVGCCAKIVVANAVTHAKPQAAIVFFLVRRRKRHLLEPRIQRRLVHLDQETILHVFRRADFDLELIVAIAGLIELDAHLPQRRFELRRSSRA